MAALLERLYVRCVVSGRASLSAPGGEGLGAWGLLLLEGFCEALQSQVVVPLLGELLVLVVKRGVEDVTVVPDEA